MDHGDVGDFTSPLTLDEQGVPSLVNPEKYRLSGINPGVDFLYLGRGLEQGNRRIYYSVNLFNTKLKANGQGLIAGVCCLLMKLSMIIKVNGLMARSSEKFIEGVLGTD